MEFRTFNLLHAREFTLPKIIKGMRCGRLKITGVLSHSCARCVTTRAHARVISQSSFIEVRMRQSIHNRDPFVLKPKDTQITETATWQMSASFSFDTVLQLFG